MADSNANHHQPTKNEKPAKPVRDGLALLAELDECPSEVPNKFRHTLKQVSDNSWILGGVLISRHSSETSGPCWEDGEGGFYTISAAPDPMPPTQPPSPDFPLRPLMDFDDQGGVWEIGRCMMRAQKVKLQGETQEHATLEALREEKWGFKLPRVYYHGHHDGFYYIVYEAFRGERLSEVWPTLKDVASKTRIIEQVANIIQELSTWDGKWRGKGICGADGGFLLECIFTHGRGSDSDFTPRALQANCKEAGMDSEDLVFAHNLLMPSLISMESDGSLGITGWDLAGFFPKEWIRTKLSLNVLLQGDPAWSMEEKREWIVSLDMALYERGFGHSIDEFQKWAEIPSAEEEEPQSEADEA